MNLNPFTSGTDHASYEMRPGVRGNSRLYSRLFSGLLYCRPDELRRCRVHAYLLSGRETLRDEGVMPGCGMADGGSVSAPSESDGNICGMADASVSETSEHSGDEAGEDESGEDKDSGDDHEDESGEGREQYDIRTEDGCQKLVALCTTMMQVTGINRNGSEVTVFQWGGKAACAAETSRELKRNMPTNGKGDPLWKYDLNENRVLGVWKQQLQKAITFSKSNHQPDKVLPNGSPAAGTCAGTKVICKSRNKACRVAERVSTGVSCRRNSRQNRRLMTFRLNTAAQEVRS